MNHLEPSRPASSPWCETKMIERAGFSVANFSAISSITTVPEPSSSAPFMIESRRGGRMLRARAISESMTCCWSGVGRHTGSLLPCRRVTVFTARSESWSTAVVFDPDVIVVRADEHVLARARRIGARQDRDDVARRRLRHLPVVRPARGHGLARRAHRQLIDRLAEQRRRRGARDRRAGDRAVAAGVVAFRFAC